MCSARPGLRHIGDQLWNTIWNFMAMKAMRGVPISVATSSTSRIAWYLYYGTVYWNNKSWPCLHYNAVARITWQLDWNNIREGNLPITVNMLGYSRIFSKYCINFCCQVSIPFVLLPVQVSNLSWQNNSLLIRSVVPVILFNTAVSSIRL
jgi:hypothetical protein